MKDEKAKARKLSYDSQTYLLMLGQFLHAFSLNELVDISKIYAKELSRIRGITSANLNTFSNANQTRDPLVMEKFFWIMHDHFRKQDEAFVRARHTGRLSRFKLRNIYAIGSSTIKLALRCIQWAKYRQHKAAVKVHMVANVASRLPHFCVYGKLLAFCGPHTRHRLAEKGLGGLSGILWDSNIASSFSNSVILRARTAFLTHLSRQSYRQ